MIAVETYTYRSGSNMDRVEYKDSMSMKDMISDLDSIVIKSWDYAMVEDENGKLIGTLIRREEE